MARDHFLAQTYLKHFAGCDGRLHVYRKSNGRYISRSPKKICHERNGDIIKGFLSRPNLLGEYRKIFEPVWNLAIKPLRSGRLCPAEKMVIAGYCANLLVCTPTSRRIGIK